MPTNFWHNSNKQKGRYFVVLLLLPLNLQNCAKQHTYLAKIGKTTITSCKTLDKIVQVFRKKTKKRDLLGVTRKVSYFIVKVQSVSRVLSWTVIFLRQSLPKGSSEYVEMPSRHLVSVLAPSGVYMHALSPKRVWALTPHFHPYNLRCGIFLLHFP